MQHLAGSVPPEECLVSADDTRGHHVPLEIQLCKRGFHGLWNYVTCDSIFGWHIPSLLPCFIPCLTPFLRGRTVTMPPCAAASGRSPSSPGRCGGSSPWPTTPSHTGGSTLAHTGRRCGTAKMTAILLLLSLHAGLEFTISSASSAGHSGHNACQQGPQCHR